MSSTAMVNRLYRIAPSWSRADLRAEIDIVQQLIFAEPSSLLRIYDSNGKIPTFTTTAGVRSYELSAANYTGTVDAVIITEVRNTNGDIITTGDELSTVSYRRAFGATAATVTLGFDPADGEVYQVICYRRPTALTSETIPFTVPDEFLYSHLFEGVAGRLEQFEHGNANRYDKFITELLPDLRNKLKIGTIDDENLGKASDITKLVNSVLMEFKDVPRKNILAEIDTIQKMIFATVAPSKRIIDSSTGKDPILTTTKDVYEYELTTASFGYDVNRIVAVTSLDGELKSENPRGYGLETEVWDTVSTRKAVGSTKAKVIFNYDPSGLQFYVHCYSGLSSIENENDELSIPEEFVYPYLYEGVAGRLALYKLGGSRRYEYFEKKLLPEIRYLLDKEAGSSTVITEPKGY